MKFVWDPAKNRSNQRKHGVSFEEACELFQERRDWLEIFDEDHSAAENRFIAIGSIVRGVAVVVYVAIAEDVLRIVSARRATRRKENLLEKYWKGKSDA